MSKWTVGDVSLSETLTDLDHLYPGHINELRNAAPFTVVVDPSGLGQFDTVQGAINELASTGGTILIKEGTYTIDSVISIPANITLRGVSRDKTILKLVDNATFQTSGKYQMVSIAGNNAIIENLTIDGNSTNQAENYYGIFNGGYNNVSVNNINVINVKYRGIVMSSGDYCVVDNCYLSTIGDIGILFESQCKYGRITNNYILNSTSHAVNINTNNTQILVYGNIAINSGEGGFWAEASNTVVKFINNISINSKIEGFQITDSESCEIINNIVWGTTADFGISTWGYSNDCANAKIVGNTVYNSFKDGIHIRNSKYTKVTNNHIYRCCTGGGGNGITIAEANATGDIVSENTVVDDRATKLHINGIIEVAPANYNIFTSNVVFGFVTAGVVKTGANSVEANNISA